MKLQLKYYMDLKKTCLNKIFIIFILLSIFYLAGNIIWYLKNTPILITVMDSAIHFLDVFYPTPAYHAPLITIILKTMFLIFGKQYFDLIIILINYVFLICSLIIIFKITKTIKDELSALVAVVLFALTPVIYALSRVYGINDYHLILPTTFNMYALIKSDCFRKRKWSLLYGISVAFGMMVKDSFIIFFPGALIYAIIKIYFIQKTDIKKISLNVFFMSIVALLLMSPHYLNSQIINKMLIRPVSTGTNAFEFEKLRVFTIGLYEEMLSIPLLFLFVLALFFYIKKYKNENKYFILLYLLFPWTVLMLLPSIKIVAYGAAFIPAISIITAIGISYLSKKIKQALLSAIILICLFQYFIFSYNIDIGLNKPIFKYENHNFYIYNTGKPTLFYLPEKDNMLLYIDKNNEITPAYNIKKCFFLLNHIKNEKIHRAVLITERENESVIWKTFFRAMGIIDISTDIFRNFKIHKKINMIICIGNATHFENEILNKTNYKDNFYKTDEFYLDSLMNDNDKATIYKHKF